MLDIIEEAIQSKPVVSTLTEGVEAIEEDKYSAQKVQIEEQFKDTQRINLKKQASQNKEVELALD